MKMRQIVSLRRQTYTRLCLIVVVRVYEIASCVAMTVYDLAIFERNLVLVRIAQPHTELVLQSVIV
jgi:hypothetical protein